MIYLDNAATSRFKPKCALDALLFDVSHSANSGRGSHDEAVDKSIRIQKCRDYLLSMLGASEEYSLVFTKNCTEAINLAIFGLING
ncbi:MAG TPA: cysteine desulfurase, partial [Clostridiales bacterium]|nr:cysteine desulfurase [Clostridiales bacterium]